MIRTLTSIIFILAVSVAHSQRLHVGIFGGLAAYNGDLTEEIFPKKVTNGAIGVTANYQLTPRIVLRGGLTYAVVGGADRFSNSDERKQRNLSFETSVIELSAVGEYYLLDMEATRFSPYIFTGVAGYHFNPYAFNVNDNNRKVFLQPLGTEGQGIDGYPLKPYKLTQFAVPFGGGVKFALTENWRIGIEGGLRILFTDHFDDVSTSFPDEADLLAARGQLAVDMSYRGDEVGSGPAYPVKGYQRGGAEAKDYYYFTGIHLTYRMGGGKGGGPNKTGCPVNIY
jgi:hypothetical protein